MLPTVLFQGQEAAVAFFSMAASSDAEQMRLVNALCLLVDMAGEQT